MSTPHLGAELAKLASVLSKMFRLGGGKHLPQLQRGSETIMEISKQFKDRATSLCLVSCYESEAVLNLGVSLPSHDYSNVR